MQAPSSVASQLPGSARRRVAARDAQFPETGRDAGAPNRSGGRRKVRPRMAEVALCGARERRLASTWRRAAIKDDGKRWSRPVSRVLYASRRDSHSSRPDVAVWLQQPTREQRGPRYRSPIWSCSEWGLPCRTALPASRCALTAPFHPYLIPLRGHRRSALCCTGRQLAPPRRYLALCPAEPGLSSMHSCARRDCPADSACKCRSGSEG